MNENIENTEAYEARHAAAMDQIRLAANALKDTTTLTSMQDDLETASQENASLRKELDELKAQRGRDMEELDSLIAQLKPLIGDA